MARKRPGARASHAATAALAMLDAAGVSYAALPYQHDPRAESFGLEAAQALGKDPACVFKTIMVTHEKNWATVMVPVSATVDLKATARELGWKKASLATPSAAQTRTGYVVGGISPLGQKIPSPTLLDQSAQDLPTVLVSGGQRGLDVELSPADLLRLTDGRYAPLAA
ncbi:Cys-tRNA(Pro) deacylase [Kocuria atrinae]|nr:Cys-tRNA(Pro) deacylase [Kocuria sp.]